MVTLHGLLRMQTASTLVISLSNIKENIMDKNYLAPSMTEVEIMVEGAILTSSFDSINNTENLTWDEYEEL